MKVTELINESLKSKSIRELTKQKDQLLDDYHAAVKEIDAQIESIRAARGQKKKETDMSGYHEQGRDREYSNPRGPGG